MKNNHTNFQVQAHARTDKGRRPNNEDFVTYFEPSDPQERQLSGCIYIVADGVGGASIGERASQYAAEKVLYEYLQHPEIAPGARLKQVISRVNREIYKYAHDKGIRMATTMTVAVVFDHSLITANVGDSRIYLIRRNQVNQITQDHNLVGEMVRDGVVTEAEALKNKAKNRLTRSIGGDEEVHVDVFGPIPLQAGDKIVLCSDGLTRYAVKEDIADLTATGSPEQITENLVAFAKERGHGGADNISVITVAYEPAGDLETILSTPRPEAPERPWDILETVPQTMQRRVDRQSFHLLIPTTILIGIIGIGSLLALTFKDQIAQLFYSASSTPTITSTIDATVPPMVVIASLPPQTLTLSATLTLTPDVTGTPTPSTAPVLKSIPGFVSCPKGVNIRSNPSTNAVSLQSISVNSPIQIVGRAHDDNEVEKDWYRIEYTPQAAPETINHDWVAVSCVKVVDETLQSQIPILDSSGNPIDNNATQPPVQ
jgi:serine/threonine protein phosphatase PrpC